MIQFNLKIDIAISWKGEEFSRSCKVFQWLLIFFILGGETGLKTFKDGGNKQTPVNFKWVMVEKKSGRML